MAYDFTSLSFADFEDLSRALIGAKLGIRFEAFAAGPDGGMDGRHARDGKSTILQAKQYVRSTFASLKSAMRRERPSIDRIDCSRYIMTTAQPMTSARKAALASIIGPALMGPADIFGREDLNALLGEFPQIEKAHMKLWLSSTAVLERVLRASQATFTGLVLDDIWRKVQLYAPNESFDEARDTLEQHHVLIVSGPPGVGKTTLAEMLSYAYSSEDWQLVPIRSLDDGFAEIIDSKKQAFLFDDFLGRISLDRQALASKDSDLARFIRRIKSSPNARFILTTRAYIFEEARRVSEHLADEQVNISKYVLDVGKYTRRIRARILYNHLLVAGAPRPLVAALASSADLPKLVDHPNYNPRVVEWMTDGTRIRDIAPEDYPARFLAVLANPAQLWDTAFRTHIPQHCRHLLISMFFGSEFADEIATVRTAFTALHPLLAQKYNQPHGAKDFEDALKILEGGFIKIVNGRVSFVNPSLRDFLATYLDDLALLQDLVPAAQNAAWANRLWEFGRQRCGSDGERRALAALFLDFAPQLLKLPTLKRISSQPYYYERTDLQNAYRVELLMEWFEATSNTAFAELAIQLAKAPPGGFSPGSDGPALVQMAARLYDIGQFEERPLNQTLVELFDAQIIKLLQWCSSEDLEMMSNAIEEASPYYIGAGVEEALLSAIAAQLDNLDRNLSDMDSEAVLSEHKDILKRLGPKAGILQPRLDQALSKIDDRIAEVEEQTPAPSSPSIGRVTQNADKFDNEALRNLFMPLGGA